MTNEIAEKLVGKEWAVRLHDVLFSEEFNTLGEFLQEEKKTNTVYPEKDNIFRAFQLTPYNSVKIVLLAQDPYHDSSATGLCFANDKLKLTPSPSLREILAEVEDDLLGGFDFVHYVDQSLENWASQGVLLLNTALTVRKGTPGSHVPNWRFFTNAVIQVLNNGHTGLIYMLWGKYAQTYKSVIDISNNHILETGHPATASYGKSRFRGCKHFSKANELLTNMNGKDSIINWYLE